jgi:hypothetical protein
MVRPNSPADTPAYPPVLIGPRGDYTTPWPAPPKAAEEDIIIATSEAVDALADVVI